MLMCLVGSAGSLLCLIENFYALLLGRLLFGLAMGTHAAAIPRYIEEYVPPKIYSICAALFCFS